MHGCVVLGQRAHLMIPMIFQTQCMPPLLHQVVLCAEKETQEERNQMADEKEKEKKAERMKLRPVKIPSPVLDNRARNKAHRESTIPSHRASPFPSPIPIESVPLMTVLLFIAKISWTGTRWNNGGQRWHKNEYGAGGGRGGETGDGHDYSTTTCLYTYRRTILFSRN